MEKMSSKHTILPPEYCGFTENVLNPREGYRIFEVYVYRKRNVVSKALLHETTDIIFDLVTFSEC